VALGLEEAPNILIRTGDVWYEMASPDEYELEPKRFSALVHNLRLQSFNKSAEACKGELSFTPYS